MVLSICAEALIRLTFSIIKFWWNHLPLLIILLVIAFVLTKFGLIGAAIFATAFDAIADLTNIGATLFTAGLWGILVGVAFQIVVGLIVGICWVVMILYAPLQLPGKLNEIGQVPLLLIKCFLAIIFFIIGFVIGAIPIPGLAAASVIVATILYFPTINTIAAVTIAVAIWFIPYFCNAINFALKLF